MFYTILIKCLITNALSTIYFSTIYWDAYYLWALKGGNMAVTGELCHNIKSCR